MTEQPVLIPQDPFVFTDKMIDLVSIEEFPEPPMTASFFASVMQYGVMEPIIVYPSGRRDGMYRIADGRRRAFAAFKADLTVIPAMVVTGGDNASDDLHKITLIANAQRGANAFSEYEAIKELIKSGKDLKQIANETGMPIGTIKKRLKLSHLPKVVLDKVRDGVISAGAAEEAVKLTPSQMTNLVTMLEDEGTERVTHVQVKELRDVDRTQATDDLPEQLFMPDVELTIEEKFEAELRSLTNRFDMVPASKMVGIFHEFIARIQAGS